MSHKIEEEKEGVLQLSNYLNQNGLSKAYCNW